jgi:hypothetical protein
VIVPRLRRLRVSDWCVVALGLLAILPIGPIRAIAIYLLVAYLPGLAIWKCLRWEPSSIVDLALYPSLLSILPFSWIVLACVVGGGDLRIAGIIAIAIFVVAGFSAGWVERVCQQKPDRIAIGLAAILVLALLIIPFAANSFQAVAWDAPLHAAIVSRVLGGLIPPDSPMMAGQPVNYYWLYHFYSAVLVRLTGLTVYQVFALLNVHAFILFVLGGYRIASRLTTNLFGILSATWMLVFGLNAFGWIIFLSYGSQNPDKWYSLVVPFAMVKGYSLSLGSLIHEFLDGFPFPVSFAFDIAWLDLLLARANGERRGAVVTGGLILAAVFYLHPLSAVFLVTGSFAAVIAFLVINRQSKSELIPLLRDLSIMTIAAALVTVPYAWSILHGKTGSPVALSLSPSFVKAQAYSMLAAVGLIGILAAPAFWFAIRERQRTPIILVLFAATIMAAALITHVTLEAEYKLIYLLAFGLAPLVALAWNFWNRTLVTRLIFVLALAICLPTNALTSYCFVTKPPRENRDPTRLQLLKWIREQTPANAVLVEYPWWERYQTSDAAFLYLDRYWFDIAVYARRRQLIGYGAPMLEQWGYRDIELRQVLAKKLTAGERLGPADISYLAQLGSPIIVVTNASILNSEAFDSAKYEQMYEDGDLRIYRVILGED